VETSVFVADRGLRRAPRRLAHEHGARLRSRLYAGGRVDEVACDHALALGAERHRRLSGDHAGAKAQVGNADLHPESGSETEEVERRADGALGVVLLSGRCPPHGHHGIADELLDRAAVAGDDPSRLLEVAREKLANLLGVSLLR
jgi:hypothetical protein